MWPTEHAARWKSDASEKEKRARMSERMVAHIYGDSSSVIYSECYENYV